MAPARVWQLAQVLDTTGIVVAGIRDHQWASPTPCSDWNVHALLNHLVVGNHLFAALLREQTTLEEARGLPPTDLLGDRPLDAYRDSAAAVVDAFGHPGVLRRTVTVPLGVVPGPVALHLRITEVLVHGWDLARATGQGICVPDDIVEQELAFALDALPALATDWSPFAAPQPVDAEALPLDRLAATLGRRITTATVIPGT
jgi:uncharacterized protein (TIGR03086 family)